MALFPHPSGAVEAAVALLGALERFNAENADRGDAALSVGVGIHCGTVSFGILGENQRMQGTVIGDAVNVAARIEGLTRQYHAGILISDALKAKMHADPSLIYRRIDRVAIRGRRAMTVVWEVLAPSVVAEHAARIDALDSNGG